MPTSSEFAEYVLAPLSLRLIAIPLPENNQSNAKNHTSVRYKVYGTSQHQDSYTLDGLDQARFYAVQYTYGKQSPFAYAESRRFIIETGASDGGRSQARPPVQAIFNLHIRLTHFASSYIVHFL